MVNPDHIFYNDFFSEDLQEGYDYAESLEGSCTDIFIVTATDNIDVKGNIRQEVTVKSTIKGSTLAGQTISIIYYAYFTQNEQSTMVGFYNQNFMQAGEEYLIFSNQDSSFRGWYRVLSAELQSYFNVSSEYIYYIYNDEDDYADAAPYEFFVDSEATGEQLYKIKNYLFEYYKLVSIYSR